MKIAFLHLTLTTESGDTRMVFSLSRGLIERGHTVRIFTAAFNPERCFPNLNRGLTINVIAPNAYTRIRVQAKHQILFGKILSRLEKNKADNRVVAQMLSALEPDYDAVICENDYSYKVGSSYKMRYPHVRAIWIMNNPPFFHYKKSNLFFDILSRCAAWYELIVAKRYARYIDQILVYDKISERLARVLRRPTTIVRNPVDVSKFSQRCRSGIHPTQPVIVLGVGALSPSRRFEDIVGAIALLRHRGYDASSVIVAKDFYRNRSYREKFEAVLKNSGVAEAINVKFSGVSDNEYVDLVKKSHVFVHPSNITIWSLAAFEAMAAGIPTIVARGTAVAAVLEDGMQTLLVEPERPDQIAEKIEFLIENPERYAQIATSGQQFVYREMSLDHYLAILEQLMTSSKPN
ncbi:MAG: group 1 glycosyl transferase [Parcubacteria group bacterium Gr01-1014_20]|nr:MAG: group 1 glycosyl transferase [Parcubacteria group bacterium Gr01-1014_20]